MTDEIFAKAIKAAEDKGYTVRYDAATNIVTLFQNGSRLAVIHKTNFIEDFLLIQSGKAV